MATTKRAATSRGAQTGSAATMRQDAGDRTPPDRCRSVFETFKADAQGCVSPLEVRARVQKAGIGPHDARVAQSWAALPAEEDTDGRGLTLEQFSALCQSNGGLIARALRGDLVISDFVALESGISEIHARIKSDRRGEVADYIPQLKRVDPDKFGIALCTVDGQRFAIGETADAFPVQSVCKPINYCLTLEEHGVEAVHRHIGREPSGRGFNELSLTSDGLPHNPMINSGAIMSCSLLRRQDEIADRFDYVADTWHRLSGRGRVGFNNSVYLSERRTADRNFALGYFMREHGAFPDGTDLIETLEFYFQCCSIEVDAEALCVVAATLANAGINPLTNERVFSPGTVRHCLSLMSSCGMYDYSGEFAFTIGLPAKSGVSGGLMLVIPGVMGVCVWSPRLDPLGNSVRGVEFCKELVARYNFHVFDSLTVGEDNGKRDPRRKKNEAEIDGTMRLLWAASQGDLQELRAALATGTDGSAADYDGRTALHLAASEGHLAAVRFLLDHGADPGAKDRWGGTPLTDAKRGRHHSVASFLQPHTVPSAPEPRLADRTSPTSTTTREHNDEVKDEVVQG
ncbi:glutaminase A [Streptomyces lydicus]|uniref:glutaminase A n=1 Tax=Streptomyces lydicus TaxID=47763 RepID=UPI0036DFAE4B